MNNHTLSEGNSLKALESALIQLEKGAHAFILPSGMCAAANVLMTYARPGKNILMVDSVYYRTRLFCEKVLKPLGVTITYYPADASNRIHEFIQPDTTLIYCESPGSWTFEIQDIPAITTVAQQNNIIVAADNSWASPIYCNPLQLGADLVIQALSKYVLGNNGMTLGAIICNGSTYSQLKNQVESFGLHEGHSQEAIDLAFEGLNSLPLRLNTFQKNTLKMIDWLKGRKEVAEILYPTCGSHQQIWQRDFTGSSSLFSILFNESYKIELPQFINSLKLFQHAYGWGGSRSLVHEAELKNVVRNYPTKKITNLLRLSIGLENTDELISDLNQAFDQQEIIT